MDAKTLSVLEYPKVLERLKAFCDFSASMELARALEPTDSYDLALARLAETSEARKLFSIQDIGIGGAHDIRAAVDLAARGGVLDPQQLLDVKSTLISSRELKKSLERKTDEYPRLAQLAAGLSESHGIVDAISRVLSERGELRGPEGLAGSAVPQARPDAGHGGGECHQRSRGCRALPGIAADRCGGAGVGQHQQRGLQRDRTRGAEGAEAADQPQ